MAVGWHIPSGQCRINPSAVLTPDLQKLAQIHIASMVFLRPVGEPLGRPRLKPVTQGRPKAYFTTMKCTNSSDRLKPG